MPFTAEIDAADELIRASGLLATLVRPGGDAPFDGVIGDRVLPGVIITQAEAGTISASSLARSFTIAAGELAAAGFAAGQRVKLRRADGALVNRGPFTVTAVTATLLTVSEPVDDMAPVAGFTLYATSAGAAQQTIAAVLVDPRSMQFRGQQFASGELALHEHIAALVAAKGVSPAPAPGDTLILPSGAGHTVVEVAPAHPDGVPIYWELLAKA